jgi:hypothetical protein
MRVLTLCELMRFSPAELRSLRDLFSAVLPTLPEGSLDRRIALINIRNIQRELTRRDMVSGPWR